MDEQKILINGEMDGLNRLAKDFEKNVFELDKKITDLKDKASVEWATVYMVEYYDGDNSWTRVHEVYPNLAAAEKRFNELIPMVFKHEVKKLWLENHNWKEVHEYRSDDLQVTHDTNANYIENKKRLWETPSVWYWPNVWRAYDRNYYTELALYPLEIWKQIIDKWGDFYL